MIQVTTNAGSSLGGGMIQVTINGIPILPCSSSIDEYARFKEQEREAFRSNITKYECNHDMKEYQGFTESYKYCTKCNKKENT